MKGTSKEFQRTSKAFQTTHFSIIDARWKPSVWHFDLVGLSIFDIQVIHDEQHDSCIEKSGGRFGASRKFHHKNLMAMLRSWAAHESVWNPFVALLSKPVLLPTALQFIGTLLAGSQNTLLLSACPVACGGVLLVAAGTVARTSPANDICRMIFVKYN